ncbi:MAG: hypothetical protein EOS67_22680 [Mesorhizobium sp.]|nr:MAG: hypothetical protein EOS67_22680 [Mesorhizobium sp.]
MASARVAPNSRCPDRGRRYRCYRPEDNSCQAYSGGARAGAVPQPHPAAPANAHQARSSP